MRSELRLALAMRGGVSLAVWIGGAVAEIDAARRARPEDDGHRDFWSQVLREATPYDRVVVDILAGASAGGLNGALYAASQVYDFNFQQIRDLWLDVGSTESLVRRTGPWPSLFKGDEHFLATVHESLSKLTAARLPPAQLPPAQAAGSRLRVELALSGTVMEPVMRPLPSPVDEGLVERRYASGFRFRQPEEPWLPTDYGPPGAPSFDQTLWRLAIAARSTSSFPVAFEGAEVRSSRRATFTAPPPPPAATGPETDLDGTFLDRSDDKLPFVVADGGILDNIPIQSALDFIANAPAAGPTERFLVYLQPGASTMQKLPPAAPEAPSPEGRRQVRRSTMAVGRGVVAARVAGETINADIAAIEAYNEAIGMAETLRRATFARLTNPTELVTAANERRETYRPMRASYAAGQAFALLLDPMGVMGEDQFPVTVAGQRVGDQKWRSPIAGWSEHDREGLQAGLYHAIDSRLRRPGASVLTATGDIGPLLRVTDLLIAWARWLERLSPAASQVKGSLYRVRAFLGAVLERSWRMTLVSAAAVRDGADDTFAGVVLQSLARLTDVGPPVATAALDALRTGEQGPLEEVCKTAIARIDDAVRDCTAGVPSGGGGGDGGDGGGPRVDLLAGIAGLLVELVQPLAAAPPDTPRPVEKLQPAELLHRALGGVPVTVEVLEALEVLCLPEFVSGRPCRRRVDFRRLSTANRTPVAPHFKALLAEAQAKGLWWDPKVACPKDPGDPVQEAACLERQQGIHVTLKLAGNELANFSAFLLAHWRANDWLWGRLDAVPTLVDLLVRRGGLRAKLAGSDAAGALQTVHDLVVPRGHPLGPRLEALVWEPSRQAVAAEIADLLAAAPAGDELGRDDDGVAAIRTALIASRQWQILDQEKALPKEPMGNPPQAADQDLLEWVAGYAVGAETLRTTAHTADLLDRFSEIATAATETALYNVSLPGSRLRPPPPLAATAVRRAGPTLGRWLAKKYVEPPPAGGAGTGRRSRLRAVVAVAVAALVVLAVLGWFTDKWAFVIGLVVSLLPLGALVVFLYYKIRWLLGAGRRGP